MIISHQHRYLFVELPHTASTAIRRELLANYDGSPIMHKHATYIDFERTVDAGARSYFVFSCIRNPLDVAVTLYHRCRRTDLRSVENWKGGHDFLRRWLIEGRRHALVKSARSDFASHFRRSYRFPHSDWSSLSHRDFDFVIRYENLQEDFGRAIELLGMEIKRPLPRENRTPGKAREFSSYYTPEIIARARWVFGPYMQVWGYDFPVEWGDESVHWLSRLEYRIIVIIRNFYWRHVRWRIS
ncbi:sulfotransferase family 2 domain-containing protein [Chloroflexota bacterium]